VSLAKTGAAPLLIIITRRGNRRDDTAETCPYQKVHWRWSRHLSSVAEAYDRADFGGV